MNSTSPDVAIPDLAITDYVLRPAARLADKPALIDGPSGRTLPYGQLAGSPFNPSVLRSNVAVMIPFALVSRTMYSVS